MLCVSHPIMIHIAFIQGPVAMAAAASIARDVDASFFPKRMSLSSHVCHNSPKYDSLHPSVLKFCTEIWTSMFSEDYSVFVTYVKHFALQLCFSHFLSASASPLCNLMQRKFCFWPPFLDKRGGKWDSDMARRQKHINIWMRTFLHP